MDCMNQYQDIGVSTSLQMHPHARGITIGSTSFTPLVSSISPCRTTVPSVSLMDISPVFEGVTLVNPHTNTTCLYTKKYNMYRM